MCIKNKVLIKKIIIVLLISITAILLILRSLDNNVIDNQGNTLIDINNNQGNLPVDIDEIETKKITPIVSFEEQIAIDVFSSFNSNELKERVLKMKESPEKVLAYSYLLDFKNAFKLNNKLLLNTPDDQKIKIGFIIKDMEGNVISDVKVKNLISEEEILSGKNGKGFFTDFFINPIKLPIFIEKEGYASYAYNYNVNYNSRDENGEYIVELNIKKATSKIINYKGKKISVKFNNSAEIIIPANGIVSEGTNKYYNGKIRIDYTGFSKEEVLNNNTLRSSLNYAVKKDSPSQTFTEGENFDTVGLETYGMIDINIYGENGQKLNLKEGKEATIKIPVSDMQRVQKQFNLPNGGKTSNGFWYLNKDLGVWENYLDGELDIENKLYISNVPHFSNYNFDIAYFWRWVGPSYSSTSPILSNGINTIKANINLVIDGSQYYKFSSNFTNNGSWQKKQLCDEYGCSGAAPVANVTWFYTDITVPTGTVTYSPSSWTNGNVTISVKCNDTQTGCQQSIYSKVITTNGNGVIQIKDNAGNVRNISYSVNNIDKQIPGVSVSCDNATANVNLPVMCTITNKSNNVISPETMKLIASTQSGVLPLINSIFYTNNSNLNSVYNYIFSNNGTYNVNGDIFDVAGNKTNTSIKTFKIDTSKPSIYLNTDLNKWYNNIGLTDINFTLKDQTSSTDVNEESGLQSVSATFNGSNIQVNGFTQTSGINQINISISKNNLLTNITNSANNILNITVTDKVGYVTSNNYMVKYDNIVPNLNIGNKDNKWKNQDINIKLNTDDNISGLLYSKYIWNDVNGCSTSGTNYTNNQSIILNTEGKHTLYLCNGDNAGNINTTNFGTYKLDKTAPLLDVVNKDYTWKNTNISVVLNTSDDRSGLSYSKYIWNNANGCSTSGVNYTNNQSIILSTEGENTLYICNGDIAGNTSTTNFGTYKLDKTPPTLNFTIPNSKIAENNNFNVEFKLFDNLNGANDQSSYNIYDVEYTYNIIADTKSESNINGNLKSNILKTDIYSLIDASEKGEKFKIIFYIKDKAGNINTENREFIIYPNYIDSNNSIITDFSNGDKYANNSDIYTYKLSLKDKFGNKIYDKQFVSINQENNQISNFLTINTDDYSDALLEAFNGQTDSLGVNTFTLKSLSPGDFTQNFIIKMKKWGDNYVNNNNNESIYLYINNINNFKKPVTGNIKIIEGGTIPQIGKDQKYEISLNNVGLLQNYINGVLNISQSTIINNVVGHVWNGNFSLIDNNFSNNLSDYLGFIGIIDANDNPLQTPEIVSKDLEIGYILGGKQIKYSLNDFSMTSAVCNLETVGLKVIGTLQGDGKGDFTGQNANFTDLSKGELRSQIRKNAYNLIKNRVSNISENINGVIYVEGDINYSSVKNNLKLNDTLIIKDGNLIVDENINTNIGIILLKDNYLVNSDYNNIGNIYVNDNINYISAAIYADGTFRSANSNGVKYLDNNLNSKLELFGSLFSRNTIGGAIIGNTSYTLPGGEVTTNYDLAEIYDLNYVRKVDISCVNGSDNYSFLVRYNSNIQTNPPEGFDVY